MIPPSAGVTCNAERDLSQKPPFGAGSYVVEPPGGGEERALYVTVDLGFRSSGVAHDSCDEMNVAVYHLPHTCLAMVRVRRDGIIPGHLSGDVTHRDVRSRACVGQDHGGMMI
jgi:hypothetical protein